MIDDDSSAASIESVVDWVCRVLAAKSMFKFDAARVAESVAMAEACGFPDDGFNMLSRFLVFADKGDVDPRGRPIVLEEAPAMLFLDGSSAAGPVGISTAAKWLTEKVPAVGAAVVVIKGSRESGHPAISVSAIAEAGFVGICSTSSLRGQNAADAVTRVGAAFPTESGIVERFETDNDSTFAVVLSALAGGHAPESKAASTNTSVAEHVVVAIDPGRTTNLGRLSQKLEQFSNSSRVAPVDKQNGSVPIDRVAAFGEMLASAKIDEPWISP